MKFDILNRLSGAVQFTAEIDCADDAPSSIKIGMAVKWGVENNANLAGANLADAYLAGANLANAYLADANLADANLARADLADAHGANDWIKCIQIDTYAIAYTSDMMQIGCQRHPIVEWAAFSDAQIRAMDGKKSLEWWAKYKSWIFATIELCPAKPTKDETK